MKVFNLCCEHEHAFEGWFAHAPDFDDQLNSGLLACPSCGSKRVRKLLSAPRLNLGRGYRALSDQAPHAVPGSGTGAGPADKLPANGGDARLHALWLQAARQLVERTEDVGDRFAEEARKIHYKESRERAIRGQASSEQAAELAEEGIEVLAFPMPAALKNPIQ